MVVDDATCRRSDDAAEVVATAVPGQPEIALGDIVRCDIAPYFFRACADGAGALRLVPLDEASASAMEHDDRAA